MLEKLSLDELKKLEDKYKGEIDNIDLEDKKDSLIVSIFNSVKSKFNQIFYNDYLTRLNTNLTDIKSVLFSLNEFKENGFPFDSNTDEINNLFNENIKSYNKIFEIDGGEIMEDKDKKEQKEEEIKKSDEKETNTDIKEVTLDELKNLLTESGNKQSETVTKISEIEKSVKDVNEKIKSFDDRLRVIENIPGTTDTEENNTKEIKTDKKIDEESMKGLFNHMKKV